MLITIGNTKVVEKVEFTLGAGGKITNKFFTRFEQDSEHFNNRKILMLRGVCFSTSLNFLAGFVVKENESFSKKGKIFFFIKTHHF